jgi:lipid-A-disaccharide synthase
MLQAGLDQDFDLTLMAVVGITEVLPKLREFFRLADQAEACFARGEVDAVVLVDFPGFNWHIAKRAKKYGLPVYYYLPPQIWAWGSWRVEKMRRWVDHVLCNLPFEQKWFTEHGVSATFVGHPFFDVVADSLLDQRFLNRWRTDERLQVAVLPGSRNHEVHRMWPLQLQVVRQLAARFPDVEFLVAALKDSHAQWCRDQLSSEDQRLPIHIFSGRTSEIIELADCALMKSGSVSLEMMARHTPAVVMYHVNYVTYCLAKMLVRCKSASLPNLIADEPIMPEFLSQGSLHSISARKSVRQATEAMSRLIADPNHRYEYEMRLRQLASQVAMPGASQRAASWIASQFSAPPLRRAA